MVSSEEATADALQLDPDTPVPTVLGDDITVSGGDSVTIAEGFAGDATVTVIDIYTDNGVIHIIDDVLLPPL